MKKKLAMSLIVGVLTLTSVMPVFAAPKQMADGNMFDVEYYATSNPDVASVFGIDENLLYSHYVNCGKNEGRKPYAEGAVTPKFDAVYYATNNPDVVAVLGTDETMLYNHYMNCGKIEGRIPCENGTPFMEVAPLETPVKQEVPVLEHGAVPRANDYPAGVWHDMGEYFFFVVLRNSDGFFPADPTLSDISDVNAKLEERYPGDWISTHGFTTVDDKRVMLGQKKNSSACSAFVNANSR